MCGSWANAPDFYIFKYLGNRQFSSQQLLFSGSYPNNYYNVGLDAAVDLQGNGYPDIICDEEYWVGSTIRKEIVIYWNNNGIFSSSDLTIIPDAVYAGAADFNGTGLKDLVVFGDTNNDIEIYTQTSPQNFSLTDTYTGSGYGWTTYDNGITIGNFTAGKYSSFIAVENNLVGSSITSNELVLFSNNMNTENTNGFTQIPIWTGTNTNLFTLGHSADINGDGNPDFVLANSGSGYNWLEAWYCSPLGNSITFETQIIQQGSDVGASYAYAGNLNNSGLADVIESGNIYWTYKDPPIPTPIIPSGGGGGGGGAVSPLAVLIFGIIGFVKIMSKSGSNYE